MVLQKQPNSVGHSATLTIPELEQSKTAVLNTLASVHSRSLSVIASYQGRSSGFQGWCSNWGAYAVIPLVAYSELSVRFWVQRTTFPAVLCHFQNPTRPEQLQ
jgi:hypothetical protein